MTDINASKCPSVGEFPSPEGILPIHLGIRWGNITAIREALMQAQQSIKGNKDA